MTTNQVKLIERVAKVEERVDSGFKHMGDELKEIKENHLLHLQQDVTDLKIQVNTLVVKVGIIVSGAIILIEVLVRIFERAVMK